MKLSYYFIRSLIESFRLVPFWWLYRLSDMLAFMLHRVIGYRRQVMYNNLKRAFPEKSETEIQRIMLNAYRNLADITLETIKSFTCSYSVIEARVKVLNPELVNSYFSKGQSVLCGGSHFNSWEWPCLVLPTTMQGLSLCAYKALSNPLVNDYYNRKRSRTGMVMLDMDQVYAALRKYQKEPSITFLVADQSPSSQKNAHWIPFFNQETAFLPGLDFLSRRFKHPVIYFHVDRVRRGYYELTFTEICPDPVTMPEQGVTRAYAELVENVIRKAPENWLWTHKRWKLKKTV